MCVAKVTDPVQSRTERLNSGIQGVADVGLHDVALHSSDTITNVFTNTPLALGGSL